MSADIATTEVETVVDRSSARKLAAQRRMLRGVTWWQPVVVFVALVGVAYLVALYYDRVRGLGFLVPYPHLILEQFWNPIFAPQLWTDLVNTMVVTVTGLAIAIAVGVAWAVVMAQTKSAERALYPYAVVLQCIPILALVPIIGVIFGFDFWSRVLVTVMISLFPLVSNTLFGLQTADKAQRELFQLQGAGRWTRLVKLQFPAALPAIFVGLRTSAGLAVIGAIVGDQFFQRGTPGLGALIQVAASRTNEAGAFASVIVASLLGVAVFVLFGWLARLAIGKWFDFN